MATRGDVTGAGGGRAGDSDGVSGGLLVVGRRCRRIPTPGVLPVRGGHLGIVLAALFLVAGMGIAPRPGSVVRVFAITVGYTAFVALIDGLTGANYMYLRRPPGGWTLLRILGPWPRYLVSATGAGLVLLTLLDAPFRPGRHAAAAGRELGAGKIPAAKPADETGHHRPGEARPR